MSTLRLANFGLRFPFSLWFFPHIPLLEERCWSFACFSGFLQVMNEQRIFPEHIELTLKTGIDFRNGITDKMAARSLLSIPDRLFTTLLPHINVCVPKAATPTSLYRNSMARPEYRRASPRADQTLPLMRPRSRLRRPPSSQQDRRVRLSHPEHGERDLGLLDP